MAACDINALIEAAACFICLPPGTQELVELQMLCDSFGGNTIYYGSGPNPDPNASPDADPIIPPPYARGNPYSINIQSFDSTTIDFFLDSPFDRDQAVFGTDQLPDPIPIVGFWLQRSSVETSSPNEPDFVYPITGRTQPITNGNWKSYDKNAHTWNDALTSFGSYADITAWELELANGLPYTVQAPFPGNDSFYSYRAMLIIGPIPEGIYVGQYFQLDFNVVQIFGSYTLQIAGPPTVLSWNAPQLRSPVITLSRSCDPGCPSPCPAIGCVKIDYAWSYPGPPVDFSVYKSYDNITFTEVVLSVPTGPASWYDSDPAALIYYKFVANFSSGERTASNTVTTTNP